MSYTVHIRHDAEIDIEEAAFWYEKQREGLGGEFLDEIQSTLRLMAQNPFTYTVVHRYTRHVLIKRFPFGIYFRIEHNLIVVIAVMHSSRHPKRWQKRT